MSTSYKCGDALWLGSKGMYGSLHLWIKSVGGLQVKLCDPSLTRVTPECFRDEYHNHTHKALYKCPIYLLHN